jgi:hypothetical protein
MDLDKSANTLNIKSTSPFIGVLKYITVLFKIYKYREITLLAVGQAIGNLIDIIESVKYLHAGLYQNTKISTVIYQIKDRNGRTTKSYMYGKMEVTLSFDEPAEKGIGFVNKLDEKIRLECLKIWKEKYKNMNFMDIIYDTNGIDTNFSENLKRNDGRGSFRGRGRGQRLFRGRGRGQGLSRGGGRGLGFSRGKGKGYQNSYSGKNHHYKN